MRLKELFACGPFTNGVSSNSNTCKAGFGRIGVAGGNPGKDFLYFLGGDVEVTSAVFSYTSLSTMSSA